ncbi:hypothetical protein SM033_00073 [Vibrio phage vB_VpaM_sm033]|nr:hypothetical protein SM033_00073 [Vibrio phage vB_VpaM_sm033]
METLHSNAIAAIFVVMLLAIFGLLWAWRCSRKEYWDEEKETNRYRAMLDQAECLNKDREWMTTLFFTIETYYYILPRIWKAYKMGVQSRDEVCIKQTIALLKSYREFYSTVKSNPGWYIKVNATNSVPMFIKPGGLLMAKTMYYKYVHLSIHQNGMIKMTVPVGESVQSCLLRDFLIEPEVEIGPSFCQQLSVSHEPRKLP